MLSKSARNALRLAQHMNAGGDPTDNYPEIVIPRTLAEVYAQKRAVDAARAAQKIHKPTMDDIFSQRLSGFEGAEPIAMPANLDELMAYLRRQHHATGGRAHFGYGGDTDSDSHPEKGETGTASAERSAEAQAQQDNSAAARQEAERTSPDNARGESAGQQIGQMGRGAGEGNGLAAAIGDSSGGMFGFGSGLNVGRFGFGNDFNAGALSNLGFSPKSPDNLQEYTAQRMNTSYAGVPTDTPYQGTKLSAAMDPSDAFGMGYPALVGVQNTRAGGAGFLGSGMGESGKFLDPTALNGGAIGMFQDTGSRARALKDALGIAQNVTGPELRAALAGTGLAQLGFALNEIASNPGYRDTARAMATGTNAANVADTVTRNFERPSLEDQINSAPSRQAFAQAIMSGKPTGANAPIDFTPGTQYAGNIPTPIARPSDLGTVPTTSIASNTPASSLAFNGDPFGMSRYSQAINGMLNSIYPDSQTKVAKNQTIQNSMPFIGSTEDPELIAAQQEKQRQDMLLRLARGYASGGEVTDHVSHALQLAASMGRGSDTMLAHINPREASLLKRMGGSGKRNPHTGLIEFDDETPDTKTENDKYHDMMNQTGWGSEDPSAIASFNANNAAKGYGLSGPQSTQGELAVGQRVPDTMVPGKDGQMHPNFGSQVSDFFGNIFDPKFMGVNDPKYAEMAARKDNPNVGDMRDHGGGPDRIVPLAQQAEAPKPTTPEAPIVPNVPITYTPSAANTPAAYADFGALSSVLAGANNQYGNSINFGMVPGYRTAATGGRIGENNALANALRMLAMQGKS